MTRYELLIELNDIKYMVDVDPNIPVSLNFQQSDITDPLSRQASYSKTIKLLDTPNNRMIFSDLSDINSELDFNPNLKIKAWILVDSIVNFQGYLQIKNFTSGRFSSDYDAVIYSDLDNIFKNIGDKNLSQLNLDNLNHTLTLNAITSSWTDDLGYLYPIVDFGYNWSNSNLTTQTEGIVFDGGAMRPVIKSKEIFDRIFSDAGYTYDSSFINGDEFNKLFELYPIELKADLEDRYVFTVGLNSDQNITKTYSESVLGTTPFSSTGDKLRFSNEAEPNGDPDNLWDTTQYEFINTIPFQTSMYFYTDIEVWVFDPLNATSSYGNSQASNGFGNAYGALTIGKKQGSFYQTMNQLVIGKTNSQNIVQVGTPPQWDYYGNLANQNQNGGGITYLGFTMSGGYKYLKYKLETRTDFASPNNVVPLMSANGYEQLKFQLNTNFNSTLLSSITSSIPLFIVKETQTDGSKSLIYSDIATTITTNMPINMAKLLPTNIKQKDWFLSIIRMFNLVLEPSKEIPNHIIIKPRDEYFSGGEVKDWTSKLDASQSLSGQILGDTQNKLFTYTYKEDSDYLNTTYKSKVNAVYGSYQEDIANDFVNGEKKLELIHSPTPIQPTPIGAPIFIIPAIYKLSDSTTGGQGNTSFNPRILYYNGLIQTTDYFLRQRNVVLGTTFSYYPQLSHYTDNFNDNSYDLNFGQNPLGFYDNRTQTNQNLFERFHKTQFNQLTDPDSRIITVDLLLDASDIYDFKFSDKIFIRDNYYYVNKIMDYNPGEIGTCKVELIKTSNTVIERPLVKKFTIGGPVIPMKNKSIIDIGYENTYSANANRVISNGTGNIIAGEDHLVIGSYNTVSGTGSFVVGNNLIVTESNVIVFGSTPSVVINGATTSIPMTLSDVLDNGNQLKGRYITGTHSTDGNINFLYRNELDNTNLVSEIFNIADNALTGTYSEFWIYNSTGGASYSFTSSFISLGVNEYDATSVQINASNLGSSNNIQMEAGVSNNGFTLSYIEIGSYLVQSSQSSKLILSNKNDRVSTIQLVSTNVGSDPEGVNLLLIGSTVSLNDEYLTLDEYNSHTNILASKQGAFSITASHHNFLFGEDNVIYDSDSNFIFGDGHSLSASNYNSISGEVHLLITSNYNSICGTFIYLTNSTYNDVSGDAIQLLSANYNNVSGDDNTLISSDQNNVSGATNYLESSYANSISGEQHNIYLSDDNIVGGESISLSFSLNNIVGGEDNTLESSNFNILGGIQNNIFEAEEGLLFGSQNSLTSSYNFFVGGVQNQLDNSISSFQYGLNNISTKDETFQTGKSTVTSTRGELTRNTLAIWGVYTSQYGTIQMGETTTNNTPARLYPDGGVSGYFVIPTDSSYQINIRVIGAVSSTGDSVSYEAKGIIKNVAGTTTLVSAITPTQIATDASLSTTSVSITADNTNDALDVTVTGIAATSIYWHCVVDYVKIKFA